MAKNKNGIVVSGAVFVDIKGFPEDVYVPDGRNVGHIEYIHGGVSRNVVEDIANLELRPTFLGIVDESALGEDVVRKLKNHKVNTEYMLTIPNGMGTWLAVFDSNGDLAGSISQRPNLAPILTILEEHGDEGSVILLSWKWIWTRILSRNSCNSVRSITRNYMVLSAI
mgnify:CR=1 FL=1